KPLQSLLVARVPARPRFLGSVARSFFFLAENSLAQDLAPSVRFRYHSLRLQNLHLDGTGPHAAHPFSRIQKAITVPLRFQLPNLTVLVRAPLALAADILDPSYMLVVRASRGATRGPRHNS